MPAHAEHVGTDLPRVNAVLSECLDSVNMVECFRTELSLHFPDLMDGCHRADLVIDIHHGDKDHIRRKLPLKLRKIKASLTVDIDADDMKALFLKKLKRLRDCRMLHLRRDDLAARAAICKRPSDERPVIGLCAAGSEIDLTFRDFQDLCDRLGGSLDILLGVNALFMERGRIPVIFCHDPHDCISSPG